MITRYYQFAGLEIAVDMPAERCFEKENRLEPFRCREAVNPYVFTFGFADELAEPEGELTAKAPSFCVYEGKNHQIRYIGSDEKYHARICFQGKQNDVLLKRSVFSGKVSVRVVLECIAAEHLIARNHGFIFHCSYIDHNGKAILFTAPSGTGKSTQAELWKKHRGARIINGDRAAVRLADGVLLAEGIPFAGSSEYCENESLPIEAIVYLGQAPETSIRKMRGYEAFSKIWEGVSVNTWDKEDMERVSAVVQKVAEQIPVYHMPCTPDESAVIALETELRKLVNA